MISCGVEKHCRDEAADCLLLLSATDVPMSVPAAYQANVWYKSTVLCERCTVPSLRHIH